MSRVIDQMFIDWDSPIFPDTWNSYITDYYEGEYAYASYTRSKLPELFANQKRKSVGAFWADDWVLDGNGDVVGATAHLEFSYGESRPTLTCPNYWFVFVYDSVKDEWLVNDDKSLGWEDHPHRNLP